MLGLVIIGCTLVIITLVILLQGCRCRCGLESTCVMFQPCRRVALFNVSRMKLHVRRLALCCPMVWCYRFLTGLSMITSGLMCLALLFNSCQGSLSGRATPRPGRRPHAMASH